MAFGVLLPGSQTTILEPNPWGWYASEHTIDDSMKNLLSRYKGHFPMVARGDNAQKSRVTLDHRPKAIPSTLRPTFGSVSRHRIQDELISGMKCNDFLLGHGRRIFEAEPADSVSLGQSSPLAAPFRPTSGCSTPRNECTIAENEKKNQLPLGCSGICKIASRLSIGVDEPPTLRTSPPPLPSDSSASYNTIEVESGLSESSHLFQTSTTPRSPSKGLEDIQYSFIAGDPGDLNRENDEYEIKKICRHLPTSANRRNTKKYYICWAEGGKNTWEDAVDVGILAQNMYWKKLAEKKRKTLNNRVKSRIRRLRK